MVLEISDEGVMTGSGGASTWLQFVAVAVLGSCLAGVAQFLAESFVFHVLRALEPSGVVWRFNPAAPLQESFTVRNFLAASVSHIPLFLVIAAQRSHIAAAADWSIPSPGGVWALTLALMALHDAWFFWTHSALHRHKGLYRALHAPHHRVTSELGPFTTSDADPLEFMIDWAGFYTLLVPTLLAIFPYWNPIAVGLALIPCGLVNVLGHCGYHIPLWLGALMSFGTLLLPGAQCPETHYIHHVDPRFNRSLYFTWWDRLLGTYQGAHLTTVGTQRGTKASEPRTGALKCAKTT